LETEDIELKDAELTAFLTAEDIETVKREAYEHIILYDYKGDNTEALTALIIIKSYLLICDVLEDNELISKKRKFYEESYSYTLNEIAVKELQLRDTEILGLVTEDELMAFKIEALSYVNFYDYKGSSQQILLDLVTYRTYITICNNKLESNMELLLKKKELYEKEYKRALNNTKSFAFGKIYRG
jgi:hypothetical protein